MTIFRSKTEHTSLKVKKLDENIFLEFVMIRKNDESEEVISHPLVREEVRNLIESLEVWLKVQR